MIRITLLLAFAAFAVVTAQASELIGTVTVEAGQFDRINTPVSIDIEGIAPKLNERLFLKAINSDESMPIACQVEAGKLWWTLSEKIPAGQKRTFHLMAGDAQIKDTVTVKTEKGYLDIYRGDKAVLRYNNATVMPPKGKSDLYKRSGFIHPVYSPAGQILSRIHPADHIHHMGLWSPWTNTTRNGRHVDFWNLAAGQGTVRFAKFDSKTSGPVFGGFTAVQEHADLKDPAGETVVLKEKLNVKVYDTGKSTDGFIVDYTSTQRCITDDPLILNAYRYGGFGFRATEKWKGDQRGYLTSEGKTLNDADSTTAKWCAMYGPTDAGQSGILFMSNPKNRAHPEPIRIWGKGFNDSFFNFCPIKQNPWTLSKDEDHTLRYRMYIYDGNMTAQRAEQLWTDFAHPPKTVFERK